MYRCSEYFVLNFFIIFPFDVTILRYITFAVNTRMTKRKSVCKCKRKRKSFSGSTYTLTRHLVGCILFNRGVWFDFICAQSTEISIQIFVPYINYYRFCDSLAISSKYYFGRNILVHGTYCTPTHFERKSKTIFRKHQHSGILKTLHLIKWQHSFVPYDDNFPINSLVLRAAI